MIDSCDACLRRALLIAHLAPRIAGLLGEQRERLVSAGSEEHGRRIRQIPEKWGIARRVGAHGQTALLCEPSTFVVDVHRFQKGKRPLDMPAGCRSEEVLLREREQAMRAALTPAEQPGNSRREVGDQERAAQAGIAAVDHHASTRCQASSL